MPVRFNHEFTNVNIPNNLTPAKPALQNNDGVNGCSLVAPTYLGPEEDQSILVETLARFSAHSLAGIQEPFTVHAATSREPPSSMMVLHCSGAIYRSRERDVLILSTPHLLVSGGVRRGTPSALKCGRPWSGPLHLQPTLLQLRLGGSVLTPVQTRCPRQRYVRTYVCALLSSLPTMHALNYVASYVHASP